MSVADTSGHADKSTAVSHGSHVSPRAAAAAAADAANMPSSPFKVFRSSERTTDSDDSLEDSSNTLSRTPPYAGVDVEEVEMPLTPHSVTASTEALQSQQLDTEGDRDKSQLDSDKNNEETPLVLTAGPSNTVDTLFGEVSESESEPSYSEPVADNLAAAKDPDVSLSVKNDQPSSSSKLPAADVEDGEITDSDTEPATIAPSNVAASVADKENAAVNERTGRPVDSKPNKPNSPQKKNVKQPSRSERAKETTPPQRRTSLDQKRSPCSANKGRSFDKHYSDRNRSPKFARNREAIARNDRSTTRRKDVEAKFQSSRRTYKACDSDHRPLPRRRNDARFPSRSRRDSAARAVRPARKF